MTPSAWCRMRGRTTATLAACTPLLLLPMATVPLVSLASWMANHPQGSPEVTLVMVVFIPLVVVLNMFVLATCVMLLVTALTLRLVEALAAPLDPPPTGETSDLPGTTKAVLAARPLLSAALLTGGCLGGAGLLSAWAGLTPIPGAIGTVLDTAASMALQALVFLTPAWVALKRAEADRGIVELLTKWRPGAG